MKYSKLFITGCDENTRWMLPWFKENFYKHNPNADLQVFNFDQMNGKGWFNKPKAMHRASTMSQNVCWLDTDIEVMDNLESIWDCIEPNKLAMVEDQPWTMRRKEKWHNSGVVAFQSRPNILDEWVTAAATLTEVPNSMYGDQDILHELVRNGMRRMIHITDLPKTYNTLRLDLLDGTAPDRIKCMHWTGKKGKEEIRKWVK